MARLFLSHTTTSSSSSSLPLLLMTVLVAVALGSSSNNNMHTHTHTSTHMMGFHHLPLKREAWGGAAAAAGRAIGGGGMIDKRQQHVRVVAVERRNALHNHQEKEKRRMTLPLLPSPLGLVWKGILYSSRRRNGVPAPPATRLQPLRASLTPEQEAQRYNMQRKMEDLDHQIQAKIESKREIDREVESLLSQKRALQMEVNTMAPSLEIASESPLRSLAKACSWRFIAALITLSTSFFFSRDAKMAASIVSSDFLSKAGTMYVGERLWNRVSWGKENKKGDAASRSILKAFAWRAFAMVNTLIISIFFAKSVKIAGQIASTDTIIKTTLYVVHERIWSKIDWGRSYDVEYNI